MNELYTLLVQPFIEFGFMRRGLVGCLALALGCGPIGLFLVMRRMSLMGDALSHAVLPGAAIGFIFAGLSLPAMGLGGFVAGISVALIAGLVSRFTSVREDASFAAFYLLALSVGVLLVSKYGSNVDLIHILFGTVLAVDDAALEEIPKLERHINLLGTLGFIMPLVGFLGTVLGMMRTFQVVGASEYLSTADIAGAVNMALITTAAALVVAIPSYLGYNYLIARVNSITLDMEKASLEIIAFFDRRRQETGGEKR